MNSGIYLIKIGRVRYVGQAKNLPDRWARHRRDLANLAHHNQQLQHQYNQGKRLHFSVLIKCPSWQLDHQEALWGRIFSNCDQRLPRLKIWAIFPPFSIDGLIFLAAIGSLLHWIT